MPHSSPTLDDLALLNAELAALARARIPLEPELRRLARQLPQGAGRLAERLAERMEQGSTLADAVEAEQLPEVYRAIVAAGLAGGDLAVGLEQVAESSRRLADIRRTTAAGLIYPVVVVVTASLLLAMLLAILPSNSAWIGRSRITMVERLANAPWAPHWLLLVIPTLAVAVPIAWWLWSRRVSSLAAPRFSLLGWIPGARAMHRYGAAATLAEVLRMMISVGVPLDRALRAAGQATGDRRYRQAALELAEYSQQGGDVSKLLNSPSPTSAAVAQLPPLVRAALRQAAHRELFAATLDQAARSYQWRAEAARDRITEFVPPLLTLVVAGGVTAIYTIGLMWPYSAMLQTLSDALWT